MKIYTKTGDDGTTGMIGGARVSKADARLDCYGSVDELNAAIGLAAAVLSPNQPLLAVQADLFVIGSHLATDDSAQREKLPAITSNMIERLEKQIDAAEALLPALSNFILPGGSDAAARLHVARTICRRAERLIVGWGGAEMIVVQYLNRLSDWLFVLARLANQHAGVKDILWNGK